MKISKEKKIDDYAAFQQLFGGLDENVRLLEEEFCVTVFTGAESLKITGEKGDVESAAEAIDALIALTRKEPLGRQQISAVVDMVRRGKAHGVKDLMSSVTVGRGKTVYPKSIGQKLYCDAIRQNPVTFGIGPAGTGKTYLAVALAVDALKNREVDKIILTRPAVEAGEKLGFLPGDLADKVDPYLRPLYDALEELMGGAESYLKNIERGLVEIAPLAYMRGRTLNRSFIILDEAQNTTKEQMKMFLTRLGEGSKMVVTGDDTQIDLPHNVMSGLTHAERVLKGVKDIAVVRLEYCDVVRHELVSRIIRAYDAAARAEAEKRAREEDARSGSAKDTSEKE